MEKLKNKKQKYRFLVKPLCKKRHFWKKITLVKHFLMKKKINLKILHEKNFNNWKMLK